MTSVLKAMEAKSDQLNFVDLGSFGEKLLNITKVVTTNAPDQPVSIFFDGDSGKPWKPSKGMIRVLAEAWGDDDVNWHGKSVLVYGEPSVKWAGKETGGIRIKGISDINKSGIDVFIAENRSNRRKKHFDYLEVQEAITENDQLWIDAVKADATVINQIENPAQRAKIERLTK